ncbi:MAG: ABC transporter ATP-binding protein [Anaerolineae bacterium]|jgi:iron complex transport system ATP-binding protein|nr:ABC transporter ATP-binding protein [Anaerolineae bacterium]
MPNITLGSPLLSAHDLSIGYLTRQCQKIVASGLNLTLAAGELVALLGPNGAGKSTLMRTLAGMQPALLGEILLNGRGLHTISAMERAQQLSIVLTEPIEAGLMTGSALVSLGRYPYTDWTGHLSAHDQAVITQAIVAVGAQSLADRLVSELSDGERQKILIARALAQATPLILLDEPTAFLDLPRRVEIARLLHQIAHDHGRAIVFSTHDLDLALRTADRVWLMSADGRIYQGAPEDLVLTGAFATVFGGEGIEFDPYSGSFRLNHPSGRRARLHSEMDETGLLMIWTRRALERAGIEVSEVIKDDSTAALTITIHAASWQIGDHHYTTLHDLIASLR